MVWLRDTLAFTLFTEDSSFHRVGGIVSETNFKFFVQFVTWSAIFCMFVLIFMAIFVSEMRKEVSDFLVLDRGLPTVRWLFSHSGPWMHHWILCRACLTLASLS